MFLFKSAAMNFPLEVISPRRVAVSRDASKPLTLGSMVSWDFYSTWAVMRCGDILFVGFGGGYGAVSYLLHSCLKIGF